MDELKNHEKFDMRSARVKAGLTQSQVANQLKLSRKTYQEYEKGDRVLRVNVAWKFSKMVGIPFEQIIFFESKYTSSV